MCWCCGTMKEETESGLNRGGGEVVHKQKEVPRYHPSDAPLVMLTKQQAKKCGGQTGAAGAKK